VDIDTITEFRPAPGTAWEPGDAWLGGGTWLFSQPQPGLRRLLDLRGFGWVPLTERPGGLEIAATCTIAELARWRPAGAGPTSTGAGPGAGGAWAAVPLLRQCCAALLASFKVQNMATVGGNLCLALPAGAMTSLAAALDGVATVWSLGGGVREVPVTGFVTGPGTTVLGPGELLRSVTLPDASLRGRTAFRQASLSRMGRSAALVIGRTNGPGLVITVTAATPRPVPLRFAGRPSPEQAVAALDEAARDPDRLNPARLNPARLNPARLTWHDDVHGAPAWRAAMTRRFVAEVAAELRHDSAAELRE
jgi:CO/xanthine dehydrogenase FAD-binding subunit